MKKLTSLIIIIITAFLFTGCKNVNNCNGNNSSTKIVMTAKILEINQTILVEVIKSEYAYGNYILIVNDSTCYYATGGGKINKSNLQVGNIIDVEYSGQVMLSIPPQVVARSIRQK